MGLTVAEVRKMIAEEGIAPETADVVCQGTLFTPDGEPVEYSLHHGWDPVKAYLCDKSWGVFTVQMLHFIKNQNYDDATLYKVLSEIQIDDHHWDWLAKTLHYNGEEYDWFYVMAEGYPQGACLIYHPKPSSISSGDIFYVEYLAAAPWNRSNPMRKRAIRGVATELMRYAINFGRNHLKLRYGFSLHAIQRAIPYYQDLGMVRHAPADKEKLFYFEMPEDMAQKLVVA